MIVSGTLRAGDRLPKEADLAAELGLSRSSLREAVKALSLVNILDVRRGDGTYVTSLQPPLLLEALSFIVDFHRDGTVLEFLQVRRILEPAAAAMAAERIGEEEIEGLGRLLDSLGPHPEGEVLVDRAHRQRGAVARVRALKNAPTPRYPGRPAARRARAGLPSGVPLTDTGIG